MKKVFPPSLLVTLLLAAAPASGETPGPQPCEILTVADVVAVFGARFELYLPPGGDMCRYGNRAGVTVTVTIVPAPLGAAKLLAGRMEMLRPKAKPVSGLGDGAFTVPDPKATVFNFGKGSWAARLEMNRAEASDGVLLAKLAKAVLDRLP